MLQQLGKLSYRLLTKRSKLKQLSLLVENGLPGNIVPCVNYLITREHDAQTKSIAQLAETRRADIAAQGQKKVPIWYSPMPNSVNEDTAQKLRPEPGETLFFTMERIAKTGKNETWGTVLYLLTKSFQSEVIIELGACAGISAMYFASATSVKQLFTVEGSEELAKIANTSLQSYSNAIVVNSLFDDALDEHLPRLGQTIDLAYIDGHHEKVATIHYFDKLLANLTPGAIVIFDDVSWSYDMREAWDTLSKRTEFCHAIDFGSIGVCIINNEHSEDNCIPQYWNLQPIVGRHPIGKPHGWKSS